MTTDEITSPVYPGIEPFPAWRAWDADDYVALAPGARSRKRRVLPSVEPPIKRVFLRRRKSGHAFFRCLTPSDGEEEQSSPDHGPDPDLVGEQPRGVRLRRDDHSNTSTTTSTTTSSAPLGSLAEGQEEHASQYTTASNTQSNIDNGDSATIQNESQASTETTASSESAQQQQPEESPVISLEDLRLLGKKVEFGLLPLDPDCPEVPPSIKDLCKQLLSLCKDEHIIPVNAETRTSIRVSLTMTTGIYVSGDMLSPDDRGGKTLEFELSTVGRICKHSREMSANGGNEVARNEAVHWPLLDLAFQDQNWMMPKNVTQAQVAEELLPQIGGRAIKPPKIQIDYAVGVSCGVDLTRWLSKQPGSLKTVNQTTYGALREDPALITIAIKGGSGTEDDARLQLAVWLSCWHERFGRLFGSSGDDNDARILPLPVIIVLGTTWSLYFAVDRKTSIDILKFPEPIGDSDYEFKIYRLLAVLRCLGNWGSNYFRPWIKELLKGLDE